MNPLEQIDLMTKETDSKSVRDAVKQLSFAYKRSAKARRDLMSDEGGDGADIGAVTEQITTKVTAPQMMSRQAETYDEAMIEALRRAEAVLFAAGQPMSAAQIAEILPPDVEPATVLMAVSYTHLTLPTTPYV